MNLRSNNNGNGILFTSFNQDYGCFSVGTTRGFKIFNCEPFKEKMRKEFDTTNGGIGSEDGGIGIVEMLFRCNYIALVGGGKSPKYPPNKVLIWDDLKNKCIIELEFRSEVKSVKLRRDRIVVVLATKVFVYSFTQTPQKLYVFETTDNERGIAALCASPTNALLAFPGRQQGHVQLVDLSDPRKTSSIIPAHNSALACLALNLEGSRLATASEKGTLIRIYDTESGRQLHELRRGSDRADIYSMAFNADSTKIVVSSDKGTVHIFNLTGTENDKGSAGDMMPVPIVDSGQQAHQSTASSSFLSSSASRNRQSSLSFIKDLLPKYFSSQWSFAQFSLPESSASTSGLSPKCIVAFGADRQSVLVLCSDGSFYKYVFNPDKGGECVREIFHRFTDTPL